jgi:uncharacterized DUF497 family protein
MARKIFHWDDANDTQGNVHHIARHGVTTEEAESVVRGNDNRVERSRSSSHWTTFGSTRTGKFLAVVWSAVGDDPLTVTVITAYEVPRPQPKGKRR